MNSTQASIQLRHYTTRTMKGNDDGEFYQDATIRGTKWSTFKYILRIEFLRFVKDWMNDMREGLSRITRVIALGVLSTKFIFNS